MKGTEGSKLRHLDFTVLLKSPMVKQKGIHWNWTVWDGVCSFCATTVDYHRWIKKERHFLPFWVLESPVLRWGHLGKTILLYPRWGWRQRRQQALCSNLCASCKASDSIMEGLPVTSSNPPYDLIQPTLRPHLPHLMTSSYLPYDLIYPCLMASSHLHPKNSCNLYLITSCLQPQLTKLQGFI